MSNSFSNVLALITTYVIIFSSLGGFTFMVLRLVKWFYKCETSNLTLLQRRALFMEMLHHTWSVIKMLLLFVVSLLMAGLMFHKPLVGLSIVILTFGVLYSNSFHRIIKHTTHSFLTRHVTGERN